MAGDPLVHLIACGPASIADWSSLLDTFNDASLYQSWEYADVHWAYCRRERFFVQKGGQVVGLAQVVILDLPLIRIAYIPWGPVWRRRGVPDDPSLFGEAVALLKDEYTRRRKMVLRIRPNGFEERDGDLKSALTGTGFTSTKADPGGAPRTILVDLDCAEDELRRRLSKKWRNSLSFSEKEALTIRESRGEDGLSLIEPLYAALKKKKGFSGTDLAELAAVQEELSPAHKLRISLCEHDGKVVAGSICSGLGATVLGLLGVTSDDGRKTRAYYLLQWDEILWAKRSAHAAYDLNGINPEKNPTVYHFKAGLKGHEVTFLGVYDCYPTKLARWIVFLSDRVVQRLKKGNVRSALKRIRRAGR
jgi:lipid II:glycine glycyltransferase (peptidoglycan interpeptide bridge formation enzyme)